MANPGSAVEIDGGASGTRISVAGNNGHVYYFDGTSETDVTGNLPTNAVNVSDNWLGVQYACLTNTQIWKRTIPSTTWTQIPGIGGLRVDAIPNTTRLVYVGSDDKNVLTVNNDGTGQTNLGNPSGLPLANIGDVAASGDGTIFTIDGPQTHRYTGTSWVDESQGYGLFRITGGPATQLFGLLSGGVAGLYGRIYSRTETADYIDDERVRITPNDNSAFIRVAPGTYTITESAVAGWSLQAIESYQASGSTTKDVAARTATVSVSSGQVVHLVYQNGLVVSTPVVNDCTSPVFKEDFGTGSGYGPALTGLTSCHKANGPYGFGYYGVINNTTLMGDVGGYAGSFNDHTTGDGTGRMLGVDATGQAGVFYRRRFTGLIPGVQYNFSAWIMNVNTQGAIAEPPNVTFAINDPTTGGVLSSVSTGDVTSIGVWTQYNLVFTTSQSSVDMQLINNKFTSRGNDLAIDDITFGVAVPPAPVVATGPTSCTTGVGSLTVSSPTGPTLVYTLSGAASQGPQASPVFSNLTPGVYSVTASYTTSNACTSTPTSVTITPATPPAIGPISGTTVVCSGPGPKSNMFQYTDTTPGGTWSVSPVTSGTISASGVLTTTPGFSGTATISYVITTGSCSSTATLNITINNNCNAMPVSLVSFTAQAQADRSVLVQWKTSWEHSNKLYIIERSKDLKSFEGVGEVTDVAGTSNSINTYKFVDKAPYRGTSYYRLVQLDVDGSRHTYKAEAVAIDGMYGVYPNPVTSAGFTLTLDEPATAKLQLFNASGRSIDFSQSAVGSGSVKVVPGSHLSSGIYVLMVEERGTNRTYRLVVQ